MASPPAEWQTATQKCPKCGEKISYEFSTDELRTSVQVPLSSVNIHGDPQHGLVVYVDRNAKIRGTQVVERYQVDNLAIEETFNKFLDQVDWESTDKGVGGLSFVKLVFQTMEYSLKASQLKAAPIVRGVGRQLGLGLAKIFKEGSLRKTLKRIRKFWDKHDLGTVEVVKNEFPLQIRVHDCFECADVPEIGRCFCSFDEGVLEGIISRATNTDVFTKEIHCPAQGDPYCEFVIEALDATPE